MSVGDLFGWKVGSRDKLICLVTLVRVADGEFELSAIDDGVLSRPNSVRDVANWHTRADTQSRPATHPL